jgi:hypothetical protein
VGEVKDATASSWEQLNRGAIAAVEKVQEATGLKLRETLGWTTEKVEERKQIIVKVVDDMRTFCSLLPVHRYKIQKRWLELGVNSENCERYFLSLLFFLSAAHENFY